MHDPRRRKAGGFTLIELMITLAVAAILLTVGIPSFREFTANQRVKAGAQSLYSSLAFARSEALKRNASVVVTAGGNQWENGWAIASGATTLRRQDALDGLDATQTPAPAAITYLSNGRATAATTIGFCDTAGTDSVATRIVTIDPSGQPNLTLGGGC